MRQCGVGCGTSIHTGHIRCSMLTGITIAYPGRNRLRTIRMTSGDFSVNEYLDLHYAFNDFGREQRMPLFRWDNYLSIYLTRYGNSISSLVMYTHDDGTPPKHFTQGHIWNLLGEISCLDSSHGPWIFNLDLDYFFWHHAEQPGLMVSDAFLTTCFEKIRKRIEDRTIAVTTIALTPSRVFTGGWEPAERLVERVSQNSRYRFYFASVVRSAAILVSVALRGVLRPVERRAVAGLRLSVSRNEPGTQFRSISKQRL